MDAVSVAISEEGLRTREEALGLVAHLFVVGAAVDAARLFDGEAVSRVELPTYPFERSRHAVPPIHHVEAPTAPAPASAIRPTVAQVSAALDTQTTRRRPPGGVR